jgi:hypothetical protein
VLCADPCGRWRCRCELADLLNKPGQPGAQLGLERIQWDAPVLDLSQVVFPQGSQHRVRHVRYHPLDGLDQLLATGGGHDVLAVFVEVAAFEQAL